MCTVLDVFSKHERPDHHETLPKLAHRIRNLSGSVVTSTNHYAISDSFIMKPPSENTHPPDAFDTGFRWRKVQPIYFSKYLFYRFGLETLKWFISIFQLSFRCTIHCILNNFHYLSIVKIRSVISRGPHSSTVIMYV